MALFTKPYADPAHWIDCLDGFVMKDAMVSEFGVVAERPAGVTGRYKRTFDLLLCAIFAPVVLPMIGAIWLWLALREGTPIFCHWRVGQGGRNFPCFKFRTMVPDAERILKKICAADPKIAQEWQIYQKLTDDPRITPLGRFLRATSLDELPQFFNILRGDMSFVGPRPFAVDQESLYRAAGGAAYFRMRPGITGPWQVEARNQTSFEDRVHYDDLYWREMSLRRDIVLIFKTGWVVLEQKGI